MKILAIDVATRGFAFHFADWTKTGCELIAWHANDLLRGFGVGNKKSVTVHVIAKHVVEWTTENEEMLREADIIALESQWNTKHMLVPYYGLHVSLIQMGLGDKLVSIPAGGKTGWRRHYFTRKEDGKTTHARKKKSLEYIENLLGKDIFDPEHNSGRKFTQKNQFDYSESFLIGQFVAWQHDLFSFS